MRLNRIEELEVRQLLASDWQNSILPCDVDASDFVSSIDLLLVINQLNRNGFSPLPDRALNANEPFFDVNADGDLSPLDALIVVNALNRTRDPMELVAGISPASDPNGNGVVLSNHVTLQGQSLPETTLDTSLVGSTDRVRVVTDVNGRFSVIMPLAQGIQSFRLIALDEIGRTTSLDCCATRRCDSRLERYYSQHHP